MTEKRWKLCDCCRGDKGDRDEAGEWEPCQNCYGDGGWWIQLMSQEQYEAAIVRVDSLTERLHQSADERAELGKLAEQIIAYEDVHVPRAEPTAAEREEFRRDQEANQ